MILSQGYFSKANHGGVIGIAKDGHLLVGPYSNDSGDLWQCYDHDICNGTIDEDGNYVYVATTTFPYHLGCWGPAARQTYPADCSETHSCGVDESGVNPFFTRDTSYRRGSDAANLVVSLAMTFTVAVLI